MAEHNGIRTKVAAGVITGIILAVLSYFSQALWPHIRRSLVWFCDAVWSWLSSGHSIYGWLLVIFILCTAICGFVLVAALFFRVSPNNWRSYRRDIFFGIVWRWEYHGERIGNPLPYCIHCDTELIPNEDCNPDRSGIQRLTRYICDHCHVTVQELDESFRQTQDKVVRQIDRKLRSDEWKKTLSDATDNG